MVDPDSAWTRPGPDRKSRLEDEGQQVDFGGWQRIGMPMVSRMRATRLGLFVVRRSGGLRWYPAHYGLCLIGMEDEVDYGLWAMGYGLWGYGGWRMEDGASTNHSS